MSEHCAAYQRNIAKVRTACILHHGEAANSALFILNCINSILGYVIVCSERWETREGDWDQ